MKSFITYQEINFITTFSRSEIKNHRNEIYHFITEQPSWLTIGRGRDTYTSFKGVDGIAVTFNVIVNNLCLNYTKW